MSRNAEYVASMRFVTTPTVTLTYGSSAESCRRYHLQILATCLMTNHTHVVAVPKRRDSIWRTFHRSHGLYAMRFKHLSGRRKVF